MAEDRTSEVAHADKVRVIKYVEINVGIWHMCKQAQQRASERAFLVESLIASEPCEEPRSQSRREPWSMQAS